MGRSTYGGGFLSALHYDLWFINRATAREIIGYITVVMLFVLLSGILIHKRILKDFFSIKQKTSSYLWVLAFLFLDFCYLAFDGKLVLNAWYLPIILFLKAILFGGIEEVGWRYVFQPILMERRSYLSSTLMTFVLWGIWHFAYFYIEGTLSQVGTFGFLLGLLTNCFILSALFIKTKSLWICVMTHSLINVLSQLAVGGNENIAYSSKVIIIVVAILLALRAHNNKARELSVI